MVATKIYFNSPFGWVDFRRNGKEEEKNGIFVCLVRALAWV